MILTKWKMIQEKKNEVCLSICKRHLSWAGYDGFSNEQEFKTSWKGTKAAWPGRAVL